MKKLFLVMVLFATLSIFISCSANKVGNRGVQNYEQREIKRKAEKAFQELDQEIDQLNKKKVKDIDKCNYLCPGKEGWYILQDDYLEGYAIPAYRSNYDEIILLNGNVINLKDNFIVLDEDVISFSSKSLKNGWLEITAQNLIDEEIMRSVLIAHCDSIILRTDSKIIILFKDNDLGDGFQIKVVESAEHRGFHKVEIVREDNFIQYKVEYSPEATVPVFKALWSDF